MAWVKKNLVILIAAVISLGLLGFAFFFVSGKVDADKEVAGQLDEAAQKFKDLLSRKQHPGTDKVDNIARAKEELVKMKSFTEEMREYLKGPQQPTNLNNQVFRAQLDTSVAVLRKQAEEANVTLPNTNFWFTFTTYKTTVDFKDNVAGLAAELEDIKAIMRILCEARVQSVAALKRGAVSDSEYGGTADYINRYPKTNDWAITTPYEITFQGFSSELARVMEGLANAKECFVVKTVGVAQAPEEKTKSTAPVVPMMMQPPMSNPYDRYRMGGMGGQYSDPRYRMMQAMPMPTPVMAAPKPMNALARVVDESKLRFTLQVDSIKLKSRGK